MAIKTGTAVAKPQDTKHEIALQVEESELEEMAALVESTNDVQADDKAIPMLQQVQSLSKMKKNNDAAKDGMLYNNITMELYDIRKEPIKVVPVDFRIMYVEWSASNKFVGRYQRGTAKAQICEDNRGSVQLDNGNKINKTAYWTVLLNGQPAIISMAISKMKTSKAWNALIDQQTYVKDGVEKVYPRFFFNYTIKAVEQSGEKGDYFNLQIERAEPADANTIRKAAALLKSIDSITWKEEESTTEAVDESVM